MESRVPTPLRICLSHLFWAVLSCLLLAGITRADQGVGGTLFTEEEQQWIAEHPEITVTNEFDWPPFDFVLAGTPQGFGIDIMNLLSEKSGIGFRYINGYTWDELMEMFLAGEIDVVHSLSITQEREQKAFFSPPYYHSKNVLILRRDAVLTNHLGDLEGRIIALPKGWSSIEFFKTHYPDIHIIEVESTRQALEYVDQGKVFATVEQEGIAAYFMKKFGFTDLKLSGWIDNDELQRTSSMHFAVLRDRPVLFSILKKALEAIQPEEMQAMAEKWFSRGSMIIGMDDVGLTPNERAFLEHKSEITYCVSPERMPLEGFQNGKVEGMIVDFLDMFEERLGVEFEHVPTSSWEMSLRYIREGRCEILPMVNKSEDRDRYLNFTSIYLDHGVAVVAREDQGFIGGLYDLENMRVAVLGQSEIARYVREQFPEIELLELMRERECIMQVASGGADVALLAIPVASYYIRNMGLTQLKIAGYAEFQNKLRVGVTRYNPMLHSVMSKVVRALPRQEIDAVSRKWSAVQFAPEFNYGFALKILAGVVVAVILVIVWNWQLMRLNRKLGEAHAALEEKSRELERLSITDGLTGLYNRRHIEELLLREIARQERYHHPLSVILVDLDHFKNVNDVYGHNAGDAILRAFATMLTANTRKSDAVGRWGGEEFLVICPESDLAGAATRAEEIRAMLDATDFPGIGRQTASFGVASWQEGENADRLVLRADQALYRAKADGRNRVAIRPA